MMKWLMYLVLAGLAIGSWVMFSRTGANMKTLQAEIVQIEDAGDPESKVADMKAKLDSMDGERTIEGILLTFLSAGLLGIFFVVYALPFFAQRATHAIYDSGEMMEKDVMHDARSLLAQGDYEGAIAAFQAAAAADPLNRLPWVEIAKIYKDNLGDPAAAVATIRHALESQEWEVNDAAYFLFRLAELYNEVEGDRASAVAIMNQVIEQFPGTRHSANASHKLHEWAVEDEAAAAAGEEAAYLQQAERTAQTTADEEAEFLARMKRSANEDDTQPPA
ncbi:MAG: tetratricopeptide repeat protein [Verrucomicrobiota bacterium]